MTQTCVGKDALEAAIAVSKLGKSPDHDTALGLAETVDTARMMSAASAIRDEGHGNIVTYSRKVFVPLTKLCRDVCHYCTFARTPRAGMAGFLSVDEVLSIARSGAGLGCKEALFTLGDKPELRYDSAREELHRLGHATTLSYLAAVAEIVLEETGLFPHLNPGVMSRSEIAAMRPHAVSMGLMLESSSDRLCQRGGPHFGSPDKYPATRIATISAAGAARVPFTSGILIGIGETRRERVDALLTLRDLHADDGHIQEVIVQNFRAKLGTPMASFGEINEDEMLWTVAVARLILGSKANIQAPPNLAPGQLSNLVAAGINDWGGVSPITPDHVNPERGWPTLERLTNETRVAGKELVERLAIYPSYALAADHWLDARVATRVRKAIDSHGLARIDTWRTGTPGHSPAAPHVGGRTARFDWIIGRAKDGRRLTVAEIARLFDARGGEHRELCVAADELRKNVVGDAVTYVVNRNINYTNVCTYRCQFCAFSKGRTSDTLRGKPYELDLEEIARRVREAWARGATEVCMQGGIHPSYTGETYLSILRAAKAAVSEIHVHAFSPLEIWHGAETLGISVLDFLSRLRDAGLGSLPGTAAEILDDEIRAIICPDKLSTSQWLEVVATAHKIGLRSTATIMFGHVEHPLHWARHLDHLRELQERTGGFTEFVPLPFVAQEAPIYIKGRARSGPTFREAVIMHAVARLCLHPVIQSIQASWVKMGPEGAGECLKSGANDLGGTLMNESITRAAGGGHGQEMAPRALEALVNGLGRRARPRTTLYGVVNAERLTAAHNRHTGHCQPHGSL